MVKTIPIMQVYFLLHCPVNSVEASVLKADKYKISLDGKQKIFHRKSKKKGCSFQCPYISVEIGFELYEYDITLFEHWTNQLFSELAVNESLISKWKNAESVRSSFIININSMDDEQRPVFFLRPEQIELLAKFGASITLDGYLMFSDSDKNSV
jgi:hypothetical protein